jgi:hypothetical protein
VYKQTLINAELQSWKRDKKTEVIGRISTLDRSAIEEGTTIIMIMMMMMIIIIIIIIIH